MPTLGEEFAHAVAAKDVAQLERILAPDVVLRGLTPGRVWEAQGFEGAVDVLFANWFEDDDRIEELVGVESGRVEDRERVAYRLLVSNGEGRYSVEQQVYFDVDDDRIAWMSVLCSGYRAVRD